MKRFIAGPIVGITSALVMAWLAKFYFLSDSQSGAYGAGLILIVVAIAVLAPLLLANLVLSIRYLHRDAPERTFAWMWLPPLAVLVALWVILGVKNQQQRSIEAAHPKIEEVHINLTGRSLWLDPEEAAISAGGNEEMRGNSPEKFVKLTRYFGHASGRGDDKMAAYHVARLADSFREMRVFYGQPADTSPTIVPVNRPTAFPEVKAFIKHSSGWGGEEQDIEYLYYHYPDHVDVVPALSVSYEQSMRWWGTEVPLVEFHIANLGTRPIARLEIDGQAIALGDEAFTPESAKDSACRSRNFAAYAVNHLAAPLKVRWQLAQANPSWHEANVVVPEFGSGKAPQGNIHSTSVDLYFQADDSVVAERSQFMDLPQGRSAIRTTGPAVPLLRKPPCGFAPERYGYNETVTVIKN
jgi:hypothetical protein